MASVADHNDGYWRLLHAAGLLRARGGEPLVPLVPESDRLDLNATRLSDEAQPATRARGILAGQRHQQFRIWKATLRLLRGGQWTDDSSMTLHAAMHRVLLDAPYNKLRAGETYRRD